MATNVNLNIVQGSDFNISFVASDDLGDVIDLTNYVVGGHVKHRYGDSSSLFDLDPKINNATDGVINISMGPNDTEKLPAGEHLYGIELLSGDSIGFKIMNGYVNVIPEVNN